MYPSAVCITISIGREMNYWVINQVNEGVEYNIRIFFFGIVCTIFYNLLTYSLMGCKGFSLYIFFLFGKLIWNYLLTSWVFMGF